MAFNKHDIPPSLLRPLIFYPSKGFSNIGKNTLYFLKMGEPIIQNCSQSIQIEFVPGDGALTSVCNWQNRVSFSTYEGRCCLWSHKALPYQKPKLKGVYSSSHIFHQTILIFVQMWLTDAPLRRCDWEPGFRFLRFVEVWLIALPNLPLWIKTPSGKSFILIHAEHENLGLLN